MDQLETKLVRIAQCSGQDKNAEYKWLIQLYNAENLHSCFNLLDRKKAVGIDNKTKTEYGKNLGENIGNLIKRMKSMSYRPQPVKEVLIPKEGKKGKYRPLGISVIEDKMVQKLTAMVLEAIYEPIFLECSYGFRPGRNCHMAVKALRNQLFEGRYKVILDIDLKNYFGSIDHKLLMELLEKKIKDKVFLRYIVRMLKAGILGENGFRKTEEGSPQGCIASPVLANIFAHYVIDEWFENTVKQHVAEKVELFRYADDMVVCCENVRDAQRIQKAMESRLKRYGLEMNVEKTKVVSFDKDDPDNQEPFDFLGFTFFYGKSEKGYMIPRVITSSKRIRTKLMRVNLWCKRYRNSMKMKRLWNRFTLKLSGHIQYYGVTFNLSRVYYFVLQSTKIFFKWMNRRSQKRSMNWDKFKRFITKHPVPKISIRHQLC